jgi:carboxypeptidase Taq
VETKFQELKTRLLEVNDISSAAGLLYWDQSTYMPPGGAAARARQTATLGRLAHEKFTDPAIGNCLMHLSHIKKASPMTLMKQASSVSHGESMNALLKYRQTSQQRWRITLLNPTKCGLRHVQQTTLSGYVRISKKRWNIADRQPTFFPGYDHIADPLIESSDYGMKVVDVRRVFAELRQELVPIVSAITSQEPADDSCLHQHFPEEKQLAFGLEVAQQFGYDMNRGRQDKTHHPFMTKFSLGDVRITTRTKENFLGDALFSTLHETGHALYEQGIRMDYEGTPLARGTSSGVHESQSRLWENLVGRSRGFWYHYYPKLQSVFPEQLGSVSKDTFNRAINKVERSLIRTNADEVTYNLHVMLRFDLELAMLEGNLEIRDLPNVWRERFEADFGIVPPDDKDGVLQDVHWYFGLIGGSFQGYTLGNILGAQFYASAFKAHPEIPSEIKRKGEFSTLHNWLKENLYQHGSKYTAPEIIERATGSPLSIKPYMAYLRSKYGELYNLDDCGPEQWVEMMETWPGGSAS